MDTDAGSKIRHTPSSLGAPRADQPPPPPQAPAGEADPLTPLADPATRPGAKKIRAFGKMKRHEEEWNRTPNTTGAGAIHCRSFHSKLTEDALVYLDGQINEWLDAHPEYEVKFVTANIGLFSGKTKEEHLILQVWV